MKLSIGKKTLTMIVLFALLLISVSMIMYASVISSINDERFRTMATDLADTVASVVDVDKYLRVRDAVLEVYESVPDNEKIMSDMWGSDEWNAYTERFSGIENSEDFISLREDIRKIQDVNPVDCVYFSYLDHDRELFLYIADGAYEDACPPGCLDVIYDVNRQLLEDPTIGFPAYITNTEEYGWLVTAGAPVYSDSGEVVGYAMTDIPMQEVRDTQNAYILNLLGYLIAAVVVICVIGILVVNKALIKPIRTLTKAATDYTNGDSDKRHTSFADVNIKTGDEIQALAESVKLMERDLNSRIEELYALNERLVESNNEVSEMTILANSDALTGVKNKTSYDSYAAGIDEAIESGENVEFGVAMIDLNYLKIINDTYGHNAGDAAIIRLSEIVCSIFSRSPVFRIGGDEFTVIMRGKDYKNADEMVSRFKETIAEEWSNESLKPGERVSAAIGFARYDPENDKGFDDVFKRADKTMYEDKRRIKGEK